MAKKKGFDIQVAKKYLFWTCVPIGLIVAVLAGMMAIGSVSAALDAQKARLNSQREAVTQLRGQAATHPNSRTIETINDKRGELVGNVLDAWEIMVAQQNRQNVWGQLGTIFLSEIERTEFLGDLTPGARNTYREFARNEINQLLNREASDIRRVEPRSNDSQGRPIDPLILTASSPSGGSGIGRGQIATQTSQTTRITDPNAVLRGRVVWDAPQLDITIRNWEPTPHSHEVWLTQEDIWVYQALLWVIRESNRNSREPRRPVVAGGTGVRGETAGPQGPLDLGDSVIKEIVELAIGQRAALQLERQASRRIGAGGMGGDYSSDFGGSATFGGGSDSDSMGGMGGALTPEAAKTAALTGRYVDENGARLTTPDLTAPIRRMPVYLRLVVDPNRINEVLVNCANSPMPIDVLWVTINPDASQPFEFASATAASSGGFDDGGGGGTFTRTRPVAQGATRTTTRTDANYGPHVTIEIFGFINIFSPANAERIGGGASN